MKTNTDKDGIFFMFIYCLGFLIMLLAIVSLKDDVRNLKTETDELRLLFNQKFLQEMTVSRPEIRDLTYRRFEF
jgi:cytochrome c biogenesis protein CcdA